MSMAFWRKKGVNVDQYQQNVNDIRNINLNKDNALRVFPFTLQSGFVDMTEHGEIVGKREIKDATYFERIWTGTDTGVAVWDGSTDLQMNASNELEKQYQVGDSFFVMNHEMATDSNVGASDFDDAFVSQTVTDSMTIMVPFAERVITDEMLLKAFYIPQRSPRWFRISSYKKAYDLQQKPVGYWLQMQTFDTKVGTSGQSEFSTIQKSAPGEQYAWPVIQDDLTVNLDQQALVPHGVNEVQIEMLGNGLLSSLNVIGRPVDDTNIVHQPRILLPYESQQPIESAIKKTSAPCSSIEYYHQVKPTLMTYFKDWKEDNKSNYDWSTKKQFEGIFLMRKSHIAGFSAIDPWNPLNTVDIHDSAKNIKFDGSMSPYMMKNAAIASTDFSIPLALSLGALAYTWFPQLPMQIEEKVPRKVNDVPVVGKILGLFNFGNWGWRKTKHDMKINTDSGIGGFMSKAQHDFATDAQRDVGDANNGLVPMEVFDNVKGSQIGDITGARATNITLKFSLTDMVKNGTGAAFSTTKLGNDHKVETDFGLAAPSTDKFAIDAFHSNIAGKLDFIVSYFKDGKKQYSAKMQTTGKFTNNTRNWSNFISHSPWNSFDIVKSPDWKGIIYSTVDDSPMIVPFSNLHVTEDEIYASTHKEYSVTLQKEKYSAYKKFTFKGDPTVHNLPALATGKQKIFDYMHDNMGPILGQSQIGEIWVEVKANTVVLTAKLVYKPEDDAQHVLNVMRRWGDALIEDMTLLA